jgi:hypothetical protein
MACSVNLDEKLNLRPIKRILADGKTIFLHYNPLQPSSKSYIHAIWRDTDRQLSQMPSEQTDLFGIDEPTVVYSLNKRRRWQTLQSLRRHRTNQSSSTSDNDDDDDDDDDNNQERAVQSDTERRKQISVRRKKHVELAKPTYRLYEFHIDDQQAHCVGMASNIGPSRVQLPKKTYMREPSSLSSHPSVNTQNNNQLTQEVIADVTYYAFVPPPQRKYLPNIRKYRTKRMRVHQQ